MKKIAAIVVTYNRKELLAYCLEAIGAQTYKPYAVYVVDNASTDGTDEWIRFNEYDGLKSGIDFRYIHLPENIGGSGGFYSGLKTAYESVDHFDAFWLMDDDGIPDSRQLEHLVEHSTEFDYLSPLVLSKEDPSKLSFGDVSRSEMESYAEDGIIVGAANPFNGVLFSRKVVDVIGYPVREMFMWGDEINYGLRSIKAGFKPAMVINAIHMHPKDRQIRMKALSRMIVVPEQDWKLYMYVRNAMYNSRTLTRWKHYAKERIIMTMDYTYYFLCKEPSLRKWRIVIQGMRDGARRDLTRLNTYRETGI